MSDEKILIVEDESIVAMALEHKLLDLGYEIVDTVDNGEDAVKCAIQLKPDLILMDIILKGKVNGIEAAKQIKDKLDVPIIYLTAYSPNELVERASIDKPHEYLIKPFKKSELNDHIKMSLSYHKSKKIAHNKKRLSDCHGLVLARIPILKH
ncbi:response regulator [Methanobacterium sp.]|uniref:response regulator n=1 Tax=Methanobacterium sp. TaxID=2164 RepID=UPI003C77510A